MLALRVPAREVRSHYLRYGWVHRAPDDGRGKAHRRDAALPFLSFVAGLMTAAEVLKLTAPGYPFSAERVMLGLKGHPLLVGTPIPHRIGCLCESRHKGVHEAAIAGSRYAAYPENR